MDNILPTIVFDEAGNTGTDFLNQVQPYFVLASTDYSIDEAKNLLKVFDSLQPSQKEIKFTSLCKSEKNHSMIASFIDSALGQSSRVKVTIYHKDMYLCSLITDFINEPIDYERGKNLYIEKENLTVAINHFNNLSKIPLHSIKFKKSFVDMIKQVGIISQRREWLKKKNSNKDIIKIKKQLEVANLKLELSINTFKKYTYDLYQISSDNYRKTLLPIIENIDKIYDRVTLLNRDKIDPAISAINVHNSRWTDVYQSGFNILHDHSKPIKNEIEYLKTFHSLKKPLETHGYGDMKFTLPHRVKEIIFEDSQNDPRLQVVDLIASSIAKWNTCHNDVSRRGGFYENIHDVLCSHINELYISVVLPPVKQN